MVQEAVSCCALLNNWALGSALAREHGIVVDNLLNDRVKHITKYGRRVDEVNLFKSAKQHHKSASVLVELAKEATVCTPTV
jgi:hypothetical protein